MEIPLATILSSRLPRVERKARPLEPFAKLLLGVAALRDNQKDKAREILTELHNRFPSNQLYAVELDHLVATDQ
jgi:hypothetical protein